MDNNLNTALSEYLKLNRFKEKLNQEEVAKRLNITRQCYTNWENEPIKLSLETLQKIGKAINQEDIVNFFTIYVAKSNNKFEEE